MQEARKAFVNNAGNIGALERDEDNTVFNFDQFAQAEWAPAERWTVSGGLRHTSVKFKSEDHFITVLNGDDSGSIEFSDTTPVAGVVFKVTPTLNIYGNAGKGFETPTFAELAYRSTDATVNGFNFDLKPAESTNYEVGVKAYVGSGTRVNAAVFKIDTKNEIVVFSNSAGRSVFQNVDSTTREGFELGVDSNLGNGFTGVLSYTYIDASFDNSFGTCVGFCTSVAGPNATVPAETRFRASEQHGLWRTCLAVRAVWSVYRHRGALGGQGVHQRSERRVGRRLCRGELASCFRAEVRPVAPD
jgi:iron complex outermembrane receptor protein